jgi:predicted lactoylglutathione lyase
LVFVVELIGLDRAQVDAFHEAAVKAGGKDNGAPGIRKDYHPGYYGAFIIDPAGHNLEAVIHERPETTS